MKTINKHRGKFPPVEVEEGTITWVDREPTPDPDMALLEAIEGLRDQMVTFGKQQGEIIEMLKALKDKPVAEGSKAPKKKPTKAKKE